MRLHICWSLGNVLLFNRLMYWIWAVEEMKVHHHESNSLCSSVTEFSFNDALMRLRETYVFYITWYLLCFGTILFSLVTVVCLLWLSVSSLSQLKASLDDYCDILVSCVGHEINDKYKRLFIFEYYKGVETGLIWTSLERVLNLKYLWLWWLITSVLKEMKV
jgi:hypothetical protein